MAKYNVYLVTTASCVVTVEAEDGDSAVEAAFGESLPYASAFAGFEIGDWTTPSELWPKTSKPDEDYELVED